MLALSTSANADITAPTLVVDSFEGVVQTSPVTITGTASDAGGVDEVIVAIRRNDKLFLQRDGTLAPGYARQRVALADRGAPNTSWQITLPVPTGNYIIFVKAWDTARNEDSRGIGLAVSPTGLPDEIPPEIRLASPVNQSSVNSPVVFNGTMIDDMAVDRGYVAIQKFPDKTWLQADGTIDQRFRYARLPVNLSSPGQPTSEWNLTADLPIGFYRSFVIAVDSFGNETNERRDFWVRSDGSDVVNPTSTIEAPSGDVPFFNPARLAGTASDDGGVAFVGVAVQRLSDGHWLDSAGNVNEYFYEFEATLTEPGAMQTTWERFVSIPVGDYRMRVRVFDESGNKNEETITQTFSVTTDGVDTTEPFVVFINPTPDEVVTGPLVNVRGFADDNFEVDRVFVAVNRISDGQWLRSDGNFGAYQRRKANLKQGQTRWDLAIPLDPDTYRLHAIAIDVAGNKSNATRTFEVGNAPIGIKFFSPQDEIGELGSPLTFSGEATAPAGISNIYLAIKRITGRAWLQADGTFGPDYARLPVNIEKPGALTSNWSATIDLEKGVYRAHAIVAGASGQKDTSNILIAVERPVRPDAPPQIRLLTPSDGDELGSPLEVTGTATDDVGISEVFVAIKRITGRAWLQPDGSWADEFAQLPVNIEAPGAQTTKWNQSFDLEQGIYRVHIIAIDTEGKRGPSTNVRIGIDRPAY